MLRNRVIHQNELLYVGPALQSGETYSSPITSNLDKVQSISYDFNYEKSDVSILGKSRVIDRPITSSPVVNLSLQYYVGSFHNENTMGFKITPNGMSSAFSVIENLADEDDRTKDKETYI